LPYETRCKTGRTRAIIRATKLRRIFLHERTQSTPLDPKLLFWCVSFYSGAFGTFACLTKLGAKRTELVRKFVPRSRVGIFCNERTRSTPLYPKLIFWGIFYYLCAFRTVWLPYETRCKTGRTSAKVHATKSRRNFSQRTHPIHPMRPYTNVFVRSYYLGAFGTVWLPYETRCKTGRTSVKVCDTKSRQNFSQRTHPIHPIGP
jgi:hypothetical protein